MSYGAGSRPDLAARNRTAESRARVGATHRGRRKNYRCGPLPLPHRERILTRSIPVPWTGCWLWLGSQDRDGYGRLCVAGRTCGAHVVAYEAFVGPVPSGLQLDHKCRIRCCVNPDHLEPVTVRENLLRGETAAAKNAAKTACKRGHAFVADNTIVLREGRGRECRTCRNAASLARYHRTKRAA